MVTQKQIKGVAAKIPRERRSVAGAGVGRLSPSVNKTEAKRGRAAKIIIIGGNNTASSGANGGGRGGRVGEGVAAQS